MLRRVACVLSIVLALALPGAAWAREHHPRCYEWDPHFAACVDRHAGLAPAARYAKRGSELIRAFMGSWRSLLVLDVVKPRQGDGELIVREVASPSMSRSYSFPRENFEPLRQKLLALEGAGAVLHGGKPKAENVDHSFEGMPCLLLHSDWAEAAIDGQAAVADLDFCLTDDHVFTREVADFAVTVDPVCAATLASDDNAEERLRACLHLHGDRVRAAAAYRAAAEFGEHLPAYDLKPGSPYIAAAVATIAPDARLCRVGEKVITGPDAIVAWAAKASPLVELGDAHAIGGAVTVDGTVALGDPGHTLLWAKFTQVWRQDADGKLRLLRWRIGVLRAG